MKWIKASDGIPEIGETILAITKNNVRLRMIYSEWYNEYQQTWVISNIRQWKYA